MTDVPASVAADRRQAVQPEDVTIIIGLEVHVQLQTKSKLFCGCSTAFGASPNTQTCPVCTGMPGTLPVVNQQALRLAIRTGVALHCQIAEVTKWDRKNYFYPDLPKGYQISQFDQPICGPGYLDIPRLDAKQPQRRIRIERAHLEEDAGKSIHDESGKRGKSRIDLNRTGTPLLEIVTRPDLRSAAEAKDFLTELKLILTYIDVSDCNMQQGSLRCDGNINLHLNVDGRTIETPIVEIKNMNSFRNAERSLEYETARQLEAWKASGVTLADGKKQTRGWSDAKQATYVQREKEDSADYRYFPDPDLVPVTFEPEEIKSIAAEVERLPQAVREQLESEYGLNRYDANVIASQGINLVDYYLAVADGCGNGKLAANWIGQEVLRHLNQLEVTIDAYPVNASSLIELLNKVGEGELDQTRAKEVLDAMVASRWSVSEAMQKLGIVRVDDSQIDLLCQQLIAENQGIATQIKEGNLKAVGALIGKARQLNPNANPGVVRQRLLDLIGSNRG